MKLIRQLDVSLNVILYPEAQNYENHFKVGGSQTPGLSSKSQVNKATCRCSTGHSQIWWHLPALHPQVTWSQCSGVPGSSSQWRGDAVGCKADPASSWSSFIEDKSWAYSSTGSFCINWGNLSEGCYLLDVCRLTEVAGFSVRAAVKLAAGKCTAAALAPRSQFCNSSLTGLWSKGYCSCDLHVAFVCLGFSSYCMRLVLLLLCLLIFCSTLQPSFLCFAISCLFLFSC